MSEVTNEQIRVVNEQIRGPIAVLIQRHAQSNEKSAAVIQIIELNKWNDRLSRR